MSKAYSGIEHLAKTLLLSSWQGSVWVFMAEPEVTSAYFDESRVDGSAPYPVVAGFCGPVDRWIICERRFRTKLSHKPPNEEAKKYVRAHPLRFSKIIREMALVPFYATLEHSYFKDSFHGGSGQRPWFASPYPLCASACFIILNIYATNEKTLKPPIKVVYDDGAPHKTHFERTYRAFVEHGAVPCLSPIPHTSTEQETPPLLAADLYAWLLSRHMNGENLTPKQQEAGKIIEGGCTPQFLELSKANVEKYSPSFLGEGP